MKRIIRALPLVMAALFAVGIVSGCAGNGDSVSTGQYIDDRAITAKVKTKLVDEPMTKARNINVDTYRGTVQLSGFVESQEAKDKATEIARGVNGVKDVKNDLVVRGGS